MLRSDTALQLGNVEIPFALSPYLVPFLHAVRFYDQIVEDLVYKSELE